MASWLPETLYETVGQGPAPSKDYYQLLVTRSQASASRGLPSLLAPSPARLGPRTQAALDRERLWPAGSARSLLGARAPPLHLGPAARVSLLSLSPSSPASLPRLSTTPPAPVPPPRLPTRSVRSGRREILASRACAPPHLGVGRRERKTRPSVPRRSRQGREEGTVSSRVEFNPEEFFFKSHSGLYGYHGHIDTALFLAGMGDCELPLTSLESLLSH